jgi:hypothetical protein
MIEALLPPLIVMTGVHDYGPIGLAVEGHDIFSHFIAGPRTVLGRWCLGQHTDFLPLVAGHSLCNHPSTLTVGGG